MHLCLLPSSPRLYDRAVQAHRSKCRPRCFNAQHTPRQLLLHCGAVATLVIHTPGHDRSIFQDCRKGFLWSITPAHRAAALEPGSYHPQDPGSSSTHQSHPTREQQRHTVSGTLDQLDVLQLILRRRAVPSIVSPDDHRSVGQDGPKGRVSRGNVAYIDQAFFNCAVVTAIVIATPSNERAIGQDSSKRAVLEAWV